MTLSILIERIKKRLHHIGKYIGRFGLVDGLRLYGQMHGNSRGEKSVDVPGLRLPVIVRLGSSDIPTFEQVFLDDDYAITLDSAPKSIVDLGANVGFASVYFANRFPQAKIIAVEPESTNVEMLRKNTQAYPNVTIIEAGIWSRAVYLRVENPNDENWAFRLIETDEGDGAIKAITMYDIMKAAGCDVIDLLKIDIEGAEDELFSSNCGWLDNIGTLIIEFHERFKPGSSKSFYSAISKRDFGSSSRGENMIFVRNHVTNT